MKDIKITMTKKGRLRAYYWSRFQFRWFPMSLDEAQDLIRNGKASDVTASAWTISPGCIGQIHQ